MSRQQLLQRIDSLYHQQEHYRERHIQATSKLVMASSTNQAERQTEVQRCLQLAKQSRDELANCLRYLVQISFAQAKDINPSFHSVEVMVLMARPGSIACNFHAVTVADQRFKLKGKSPEVWQQELRGFVEMFDMLTASDWEMLIGNAMTGSCVFEISEHGIQKVKGR